MIAIHKAADRGQAHHGWLQALHTFSFANYFNPDRMGFRSLRVLNEDRIAPGAGFPEHPHSDMEILTYVIQGGLAHHDSMGHGTQIRAGEFQIMSAGSGLVHSEANASQDDELHLLQIWLRPSRTGLSPSYAQESFDDRANRLCRVAGPDGLDGALPIHQDVEIFSTVLEAGATVNHSLEIGRHAWVQVVKGQGQLNGTVLSEGDGAEVSQERSLNLSTDGGAEFLLFDLA